MASGIVPSFQCKDKGRPTAFGDMPVAPIAWSSLTALPDQLVELPMARGRKSHPADEANAKIVAAAVRFEIALFLGAGRYATDTAETIEDARTRADRLTALHPNGRRPLIYGITADGRSGLVVDRVEALSGR